MTNSKHSKHSKCSIQQDNSEETVNWITDFITQYSKSFLIIFSIGMLVTVRKSFTPNAGFVRFLSFSLFASLVLMAIYYTNKYAFDNIILGIGVYLGFEMLKQ